MAARSYFNPVACYNTALRYYSKQAARAKLKSEGIKLSYVDNLMLWKEAERQLNSPWVVARAQELFAEIKAQDEKRRAKIASAAQKRKADAVPGSTVATFLARCMPTTMSLMAPTLVVPSWMILRIRGKFSRAGDRRRK